jgi:single-strand DNA-binding protein
VEWVRCVAWARLAEIARKFVTKGQQVFVEGRLQTRQFEDREGGRKTVTEVVVASLRVLGRQKDSSGAHNSPSDAVSNAPSAETEQVPL